MTCVQKVSAIIYQQSLIKINISLDEYLSFCLGIVTNNPISRLKKKKEVELFRSIHAFASSTNKKPNNWLGSCRIEAEEITKQ